MLVSILLCALVGAAVLSVAVLLMGGSLVQALIVYFFSNSVIVLGLAALKVYRAAQSKRARWTAQPSTASEQSNSNVGGSS